MTCVVFETPGHIDRRAFTVFGAHAKPNTKSPIGQFGTGLKYAVAVLARMGIPMTVWIGEEPHVFYSTSSDFRGKEYAQVRMKRAKGWTAKWTYETLPFTTHLGHHWELWQVLRELESNTRDEGGCSLVDPGPVEGEEGLTRIVVEGEAFAAEYAKLKEIFLEGGLREGTGHCQVLPGPSKHVYWRGLRVWTPVRPTKYTWNILSNLDLTEDRTVKYDFMVDHFMTTHVAESSDTDLILGVLRATEDFYENSLEFHYRNTAPSPEFVRATTQTSNGSAHRYIDAFGGMGEFLDWRLRLVAALREHDDGKVKVIVRNSRHQLIEILEQSYKAEEGT